MTIAERRFDDSRTLVHTLAEELALELRTGIDAHGSASLVLSGGRTPIPLFQALSQSQVPWEKVWITLADERWVPGDHPDSNERLVREHLLQGPAAAAHFVGLYNGADSPWAGAQQVREALESVHRPFDTVVLGMGDDGHTASLFPRAPQLAEGLDPDNDNVCLGVDPVTAPHPRISLTLAELLRARRIVLHLSGEGKWQVLQQALGEGPVGEMPVRAVLRQEEVPVYVYWSP
ncbi:MAG: 6-phosphogluconolactonase [Candidatus Competibacteraceae bacterium]|nr:6-phosphogluconolactonase [Candidatus Competibacteraceae bacterium]